MAEVVRRAGQELTHRAQFRIRTVDAKIQPTSWIQIDEVVVRKTTTNVALLHTKSLADAWEPIGDDKVWVKLVNNGLDTLHAIPLRLVVASETTADTLLVTVNTPLAPGESLGRGLGSFDFTAPGNYTIEATALVPGDEVAEDEIATHGHISRSRVSEYPYFEGFEGVYTARFSGGQELAGAVGLYHQVETGNGRLEFVHNAIEAGEGSQAAHLTAQGSKPQFPGEHGLILTLDLAGQRAGIDPVVLGMLLHRYINYEEFSSGDLRVRAHPDAPWQVLYVWTDLPELDEWQTVQGLDIGVPLQAAGYEFTDLTQVLIRHEGNKIADLTQNGLSIDSLMVVVPSEDLAITNMVFPDSYTRSALSLVEVEVYNNGESLLRVDSVSLEEASGWFETQMRFPDTTMDPEEKVVFSFWVDLSSIDPLNVRGQLWASGDTYAGNNAVSHTLLRRPALEAFPYFEDFESAVQYTYEDAANLDGFSGYYYDEDVYSWGNRAKLFFYASDHPAYSGHQALHLYPNSGSQFLTLTTDLAEKSVDTDSVFLGFAIRNYSDIRSPMDSIWIRGSAADPWVAIVNWFPFGQDQYEPLVFNLSSMLEGAGHQFSATTQVRIGNRYSSLSLDNVALSAYRYDLGVTGLTTQVGNAGVEDLRVEVTNFGAGQIAQGFWLHVLVDEEGIARYDSVWVQGSDFTAQTLVHVFPGENLLGNPGSRVVQAWTALPEDSHPANDTLVREVNVVLGLEANPITDLRVYPNPAHDYLLVKQTLRMGALASVSILDLQGRELYQSQPIQVTENQLNTTVPVLGLQQGLYLLRVEVAGQVSTRLWSKD